MAKRECLMSNEMSFTDWKVVWTLFQKMFTATSRILNQMLDYHGSSRADLYKFAAQWELVECKRIDKARDYLVKGIQVHSNNKVLLADYFHLELIDAAQRRKEFIGNINIYKFMFNLLIYKFQGLYNIYVLFWLA